MVRKCLLSMVAVAILLVGGCEWFMPDVVDPQTEGFVSIESNLIAHYAFTSSAEDSSGWDNHGDPQGPVLAPDRSGNPNRAYQFDGNDDVIIVPNHKSLEIIGPITLAAWVYPVEQKSQCIVRKGSAVKPPIERRIHELRPVQALSERQRRRGIRTIAGGKRNAATKSRVSAQYVVPHRGRLRRERDEALCRRRLGRIGSDHRRTPAGTGAAPDRYSARASIEHLPRQHRRGAHLRPGAEPGRDRAAGRVRFGSSADAARLGWYWTDALGQAENGHDG